MQKAKQSQPSKKQTKEAERKRQVLTRKKSEKERMTRVLADLHANQIDSEILDKFHSSKNLSIAFEKDVERMKFKEAKENTKAANADSETVTTNDTASKRGKRHEVKSGPVNQTSNLSIPALVGNQNIRGLNLFDVKTFATDENFDHLKVVPIVDEEKLKREGLSLQIKEHDRYTLDNPFQGTIKEFIQGNALKWMEEYVEEDRDQYLAEYMNIESDVLVKINQLDAKLGTTRIQPKFIQRSQVVQDVKSKLPVTLKEMEIMESIINSLVTVICGETGSGKSTQIPQFLFEAGFGSKGMIGITQPRRLAAISLAQRVAEETCSKLGELVGYQVRFESSKFTDNTKIKFMTDGILLNEMMSDFLLSRYSVIVLDEAHERKINTDLLIGLLSRVIRIRAKLSMREREAAEALGASETHKFKVYPLRLIIMSATLRTSDFTENRYLFPETKINLINVEARMFPVKTFFEKETRPDYVAEALTKTQKIHTRLPPGGILVFLTGEEEIKYFCGELASRLEQAKAERKRRFFEVNEEDVKEEEYELSEDENAEGVQDEGFFNDEADNHEVLYLGKKGKTHTYEAKSQKKELLVKTNDNEPQSKKDKTKYQEMMEDYSIYPLYTKLPMHEQQAIFKHHDSKKRMIVVSTNVAETSLTIPNTKYVVDCGKEKNKVYNAQKSIGRFEIAWISQSSAKQREGRAGRTCAGFCYRMYSQAVYNKSPQFSDPEILKEPLDTSILTLKTIGIQDVSRFPFVTRPEMKSIEQAEEELMHIGAIDQETKKVTSLGHSLSQLPVKPRLGKLMLMSRKAGQLGFGIILVTSLSTEEIFDTRELKHRLSQAELDSKTEKDAKNIKRKLLFEHKDRYSGMINEKSDLITEANVMGDFLKTIVNGQESAGPAGIDINQTVLDYCKKRKLVFKSMREGYSLILHLLKIAEMIIVDETETANLKTYFKKFEPIRRENELLAVELIVATLVDRAARRIKYIEEGQEKQAFETTEHDVRAQIHPSSFIFSRRPQLLVYNEVIESTTGKVFLARVTELDDPSLLVKYDSTKVRKIDYVRDPPPTYVANRDKMMHFATCSFGAKLWQFDVFLTEFLDDSRDQYVHFCYAFLAGKVFSGMKALQSKLVVQLPDKVLNEPKALSTILQFFVSNKINSKERFAKVEASKGKAMREAILSAIDEKYRKKVYSLWDRIMGRETMKDDEQE